MVAFFVFQNLLCPTDGFKPNFPKAFPTLFNILPLGLKKGALGVSGGIFFATPFTDFLVPIALNMGLCFKDTM